MVEKGQMIEVAGKDVETAVAAGLTRLGLERDAVDVEVLDEGRQGMFGLGARAARVRLTVVSSPPSEAPHEPAAPTKPAEPAELTEPTEPTPSEPVGEVAVEEPEEEREPTGKEKIEAVRGVMKDLLSTMGLVEARVKVQRAEPGPSDKKVPPLVVDVRGSGTDMLVGRDGETLDALQTITRLVVGREMRDWVHVVVDVDGYKADRARSLRDLAHRMADQAVRTDRTVILEPMPPNERRVVHVALYGDSRVTTESIYEGERRRVTIVPKD